MVLLNLNFKLVCGKLACIFHISSSIFCILANNPTHTHTHEGLLCQSRMPFKIWLKYQKLVCLSFLFIKTHDSELRGQEEVQQCDL